MMWKFSVFKYPMLLFSRSVLSNSLRSRGLQHSRPPCLSELVQTHVHWVSDVSYMCVLNCFSCVRFCDPMDCSRPPPRLLCSWGFPGKKAGMGSHALLQGIFPTQGTHPSLLCLLHWQAGSWPLVPPGKPKHPIPNISPTIGHNASLKGVAASLQDGPHRWPPPSDDATL